MPVAEEDLQARTTSLLPAGRFRKRML
jgi:hypothetical protein